MVLVLFKVSLFFKFLNQFGHQAVEHVYVHVPVVVHLIHDLTGLLKTQVHLQHNI